jgi:predicted secreted protein
MTIATKLIAACALLVCANGVFSQNMAPVDVRNVVQLTSNATIDVQQDWLTVTMGITRDGIEPGAVQSQLRQALDLALAQARPGTLAGAMEVQTGQFSLQPRYNREGKISAWQGTAELILEGRDFVRIGTTAGKMQSMTISNSGFSLSRQGREKVESQVQALAIERFQARAGEIARGFGFTGYTLKEVSVNSSDQGPGPRPRMMAMQAKSVESDAPIPMEGGKASVMVSINGSIQLK